MYSSMGGLIMKKNNRISYVTGRKILGNCIFLLLITTLLGCAPLGPTYKESLATLPTQNKGNARLVFYGTNAGWYDSVLELLAGGGSWHPKITINNKEMNTPNGNKIYFLIDLVPGSYSIGAEGTNLLDINIESNKTYFIEMQQYRVRENNLLTLRTYRYKLNLRKMYESFGNKMIKYMEYRKYPEVITNDTGELTNE